METGDDIKTASAKNKTNKVEHDEDSLKNKLNEYGLDGDFWNEQLGKIGVTKCVQLKYASEKNIHDLQGKSRNDWEKRALAECFKVKEVESSPADNKKNFEKNIKSVQDKMAKLKDRIDEKERMSRFDTRFNEALSHKELHKGLANWNTMGNELAERKELNELDFVRQVSSGKILRGSLLDPNMKICVMPRRKLITIHQDPISLMLPSTSEKYTSFEFFNQDQSQTFDHVIKHWGISAAASLETGTVKIASVSIDGRYNNTSNIKKTNNTLNAFTEVKEVVVVKVASFSLQDVKHSISDEAIEELQILEKKNKETDRYIPFFDNFGSHYYAGTYKFGGILERSVQCRSKESMDQTVTLKLVNKSVQGSLSAMLWSCSASASVAYEDSNDSSEGKYKKHEDYKVDKILTKIGGPPEVDGISRWKLGLVRSNKTWAIIDKDDFTKKWRCVWDLLTDDYKDKFDNIITLRSNLQAVWDNIQSKFDKPKSEEPIQSSTYPRSSKTRH
ncbi:interferon-induced very large GTPase 1-like [Mytilus californianus]|uniref:interferon-induced very large GTPase 1-like n=1 Tax=Mytilus californianus TaxID=6549 RepID=UPI002245C7A3|nr:interferon-induced very large GTPase 1-like [Mytilus californianus]